MKTQTAHYVFYGTMLLMIFTLLAMVNSQNSDISALKSSNEFMTSKIKTYQNSEGRWISEREAYQGTIKQLETSQPELLKQISQEFDIKLKNLRGYIVTSMVAHGSGNARITPIDSGFLTIDTTAHRSQFKPFALISQDGYLDYQADVYDSLDAPYRYTYNDTMKYAFESRGKLFGKKRLYGKGFLANPKAQIIGTESFLIDQCKDRRFGIGPYVGYGFTRDFKPKWSVGLSLHYSLIKF